jgi:hypothetical protein
MDEDDLSIEKREPGFFASLFGAQPETVLVNSDGDVVGKIETEEPGFFGSLCGEEAKQVIVNEDGDKIASFEKEEPGFFGSLMGESAKTNLVSEDGSKLASFDTEEPGLIGGLLGEKAKKILVDSDGNKLATFDREEPGFVGSLLGEKSKNLIRLERERVAEIRKMLRELKDGEDETSNNEDDTQDDFETSSGSVHYTPTEEADDNSDDSESRTVIAKTDNEVVYLTRSGKIQLQTTKRTSYGFDITTITFDSIEEYRRHLSLLKMFREMDKKGAVSPEPS